MNPRTPKVSVIIPAHDADAYLGRCITSFQNQSLNDIEILVIDCASSDRTKDIASRAAEKDIRIEVLTADSCDVSNVKNLGIEKARGSYIYFADPTDWVEPSLLDEMVTAAQDNQADLVVEGCVVDTYYDHDARHVSELMVPQSKVFDCQEAFRTQAWSLFDQDLLYTSLNKLFRASRIQELNLRFDRSLNSELFFVLGYIQDISRVVWLDRARYHRCVSNEGSLECWNSDMYTACDTEHSRLMELYQSWGLEGDPSSMETVQRRYIVRIIGCIEHICSPKCVLSAAEKRRLIEEVVCSERAQLALSVAEPKNRMMQMMVGPMKSKNVSLIYSEGRFVSFIKCHNTKLFAKH